MTSYVSLFLTLATGVILGFFIAVAIAGGGPC